MVDNNNFPFGTVTIDLFESFNDGRGDGGNGGSELIEPIDEVEPKLRLPIAVDNILAILPAKDVPFTSPFKLAKAAS